MFIDTSAAREEGVGEEVEADIFKPEIAINWFEAVVFWNNCLCIHGIWNCELAFVSALVSNNAFLEHHPSFWE